MVRFLALFAPTALSAMVHAFVPDAIAVHGPTSTEKKAEVSRNILSEWEYAKGTQWEYANNDLALNSTVVQQPTTNTTNTTEEPTPSPSLETSSLPSQAPTSANPSGSPSKTATLPPTSSPTTATPSYLPTDIPSFIPTMTTKPSAKVTLKPSSQPTKMISTSPSVSTSPSNMPSSSHPSASPTLSPSTAPSTKPSIHPTSSPTISPTSIPSIEPTELPSSTPSSSPSSSPSYGEFNVTSGFFEIILEGVDGELEGDDEIDQWENKTSTFVKNYYNFVAGGNMNLDLILVITHLEKQDIRPISRRRRMQVELKDVKDVPRTSRNLRKERVRLRIVFTQDLIFRGEVEDPNDIEIFPLLFDDAAFIESYISFLKQNDQTLDKVFGNLTSVSARIIDTQAPSIAPTIASSIAEPLNLGGETYLSEILIAVGSVSGVILAILALRRSPVCKKDDEVDEEDNSGGDRGITIDPANAEGESLLEEETPSSSNVEHMLAESSSSIVEEPDSKTPDDENLEHNMIDLSLYTPARVSITSGNMDDPDFSMQDSELDSDSMLSYDVYSSNDESSGIGMLVDAESKAAKIEQGNLVVTGAPLSPSREDGPKIGTTTVIEGTGALKGIQMMTVGDIDDMDISSPPAK